MKPVLVVFDRDGIINYDPKPGFFGRYDDWKEKLRIYSDVVEGIKKLKEDSRIYVTVASNQAGVAIGHFTCERVEEVNRELARILGLQGAHVDHWNYCPYVDREYAIKKGLSPSQWIKETESRKPGIVMLIESAKVLGFRLEDMLSYVVGDKVSDVLTGINTNGKGILIRGRDNDDHYEEVMEIMPKYDGRIFVRDNSVEAADIILSDIREIEVRSILY